MAKPSGFAWLSKKAPLVGAFFMGAIWHASAHAHCPVPAKAQQAAVRQVVDGDTLRLADGRSVRLIGINAPEVGRRGQAGEPYAEAARRRLQALVRASDGRVGLVLGRQAKDHYGRTLAHVYGREGDNFEARLLAEGLVYQVALAPNLALVDCQRQAERQARQARLGLWRHAPVRRATSIMRPGFALVAGRVGSIERNRGGTWLELDGHLTVHIPAGQQRRFPAGFFDRLQGRTMEVRGWVRERGTTAARRGKRPRWLVSVSDPVMLQRH